MVTLKSPVGKSTSCTIPVKNAGNITAKVNLRIEGDSKQFSVKPAQLRVKPEEVRNSPSPPANFWQVPNYKLQLE